MKRLYKVVHGSGTIKPQGAVRQIHNTKINYNYTMNKSKCLVVGTGIALGATAVGVVVTGVLKPDLMTPVGAAGGATSLMLAHEMIKTAIVEFCKWCTNRPPTPQPSQDNEPDIESGVELTATFPSGEYHYTRQRSRTADGWHITESLTSHGRTPSPPRLPKENYKPPSPLLNKKPSPHSSDSDEKYKSALDGADEIPSRPPTPRMVMTV